MTTGPRRVEPAVAGEPVIPPVDAAHVEARALAAVGLAELLGPSETYEGVEAAVVEVYGRLGRRGRCRLVTALLAMLSLALRDLPPERRKELLGWH